MSSEKSLSLALEVAKRARSKKSFGPDEVRKARLHDLLFDITSGDSSGDEPVIDLDAEIPEEEPVEEAKPTSRKDRLMSLLSSFDAKTVRKTDEST